jgi:hypothetical protein
MIVKFVISGQSVTGIISRVYRLKDKLIGKRGF